MRQDRIRFEIQNWASRQSFDWHLGLTLHFPQSLAHGKSFDAMMERNRILRLYFNRLDRYYFRTRIERRQKQRLKRLVVEEYSPGIGAHIHMVVHCPGGLDLIELEARMEQDWQNTWPRNTFRRLARKRIFWAEPIHGNFLGYMTKNIGTDRAELVVTCCHLQHSKPSLA